MSVLVLRLGHVYINKICLKRFFLLQKIENKMGSSEYHLGLGKAGVQYTRVRSSCPQTLQCRRQTRNSLCLFRIRTFSRWGHFTIRPLFHSNLSAMRIRMGEGKVKKNKKRKKRSSLPGYIHSVISVCVYVSTRFVALVRPFHP